MPSSKWMEREWLVAAASFVASALTAYGGLTQAVQITGLICATVVAVAFIYSRTKLKG